MIAVDTNILVYAHRQDAKWHREASTAIRALAEGKQSWTIPWPCIHEFVSVVTHPRIYRPPSSLEEAFNQVDAWLGSPTINLLSESHQHLETLRSISAQARVAGPEIHDARVAAICLDHGVTTLWSADRDFLRFPALHVINPLILR